jgi:hypothetical protein
VNGYPCLAPVRTYTCKGNARANGSPTVMRFSTDAPAFELTGAAVNSSCTVQTLMVDGQLVPPKVLSSGYGNGGGWANGTIVVNFGSRAVRDICIETALATAYVKIGAQDTLTATTSGSEPQMTVVGDSYLSARSQWFGNSGAIALELGARLGIRNVATDGIGGTGYWNSGGDLGNLNDRLPAHAADNSTIYLILAGLNDYGDVTSSGLVWPTRSTFESAVTGYVQNLRAAQPNALIIITAPFCPIAPMSDSSYVANPGTNSSGQGDFLYMAQLHKAAVQQIAPPWIYIDVLMGSGWLNSSGATGGGTGLQWFTGGTAAAGTSAGYKPGNTLGGAGGGFGGVSGIPVVSGGSYQQAPDVLAVGGSGAGLLLSASIDSAGTLTNIGVVTQGQGYSTTGLPSIIVDGTYQTSPATLGAPVLLVGTNLDGQYPLVSFAPSGTPPWDLHNIDVMLAVDTVHPAQPGVEYLSSRLARSIYDAVMAL